MVYFTESISNDQVPISNLEFWFWDLEFFLFMIACQICGKKTVIQKSGAHQYGGGWAMRATKKRRLWLPNLHSVKVTYQGVRRTMRLCTKCLRRVKARMNSQASKKTTSVVKEASQTVATV